MSDKSSPLKRLAIEINVWVKLPKEENISTILRILMQVTLSLSTAWREFLRRVEAEMVSPEVESEKWRRLLLHQMCLVNVVSTDGPGSSSLNYVEYVLYALCALNGSERLHACLYEQRFLRWVEAEMVSPEVESEKWRRPLLHWMYDALNVSTDGREEDFFPRNRV
ncbi:hypothetical protein Tco_1343324 [Tanacetum coccineum]